MSNAKILLIVALMAAITYLPRMIPLAVFREKIKNKYVQSLLLYMPYGILTAMTFPAVLSSTANLVSAICGFAVALALGYRRLGLFPVALGATATVFLVERIMALCA